MPAYVFEYALPVADYCNEEVSARDAFDDAQEDTPKVLAQLAEYLGTENVEKAEFVEFDSSNVSHAMAIFNVTLRGDAEKIENYLANIEGYDDEEIEEFRL